MDLHDLPQAGDTPGIVVCTWPTRVGAEDIAGRLVEDALAAGVNVVPGVRSTYRWQGRVRHAEEHLLLIKTVFARFASVEQVIIEAHPYELPQVLWVTIDSGSRAYLDWIGQSVKPS